MSDHQLRSRLLRLAGDLPVGSHDRRQILSLLAPKSKVAKIAMKKDTEAFVAWALQKDDIMGVNQVQRFLEKVTGREPTPAGAGVPAKRGPLEIGQAVKVDMHNNTNPLNTDVCEQHDRQIGVVDGKTSEGLTIRFENGQAAYFEGHASGKSTGLLRHTSREDYQKGVSKFILVEIVYLKGGTQTPPLRDTIALQEYVERGLARGESRSDIYQTGWVAKFALNKQGQMYFGLDSQQRAHPTNISPSKGKMLYIGIAGKRPGGWKAEAAQMGLL